jgi:glucose-6-phosphate 1-dehydrogenase
MATNLRPQPAVLVVFGAGGDLTRRKIVPALYNLFLDRWLPERFALAGIDRLPMNDEQFRDHLRQGVDEHSRRGKTVDELWKKFASAISYLSGDFNDRQLFARLGEQLAGYDKSWNVAATHAFYLATPPTVIELLARQLSGARLTANVERSRLVVEKPFGHDLASARALDQTLDSLMKEAQVYRIDHYLGKETVQNILALRFANSIFEPIWNRRYIDQVQITVAEELGVEHRGGYYDHAGCLRDMIQNHLLRLVTLVAMEPNVTFEADEIRNKTVDVLRAIRPIPPDQVDQFAVRGQYGPGTARGQRVPGYREEQGVDPQSSTETYAALKLFVDNWRWQDVPFYLRSGKRLAATVSEVVIHCRPVPHRSFPPSAVRQWRSNRLSIRIQPQEGISLGFQAKQPGLGMQLQPVDMRFSYRGGFRGPIPEAYETLLLDLLLGDRTLFLRADQVEYSWAVVDPLLQAWGSWPAPDFPNYEAGSWGPEAADALLARDGNHWLRPTVDGEDG